MHFFLFILKAVGWDRGQGVYTGKSSSSTPNSDHFVMQLEWFLDHFKINTVRKYFHTNTVGEKEAPADLKLLSICAEFDSPLSVSHEKNASRFIFSDFYVFSFPLQEINSA